MEVTNIIYIRMKKRINVKPNTKITLKDVALITTSYASKKQLEAIPIYHITKKDNEYVVIDSFLIIDYLNKMYSDMEFQLLGLPETIVHITDEKKHQSLLLVCLVWIILFVGTAMTIINFHYDVSMQEVQQKL